MIKGITITEDQLLINFKVMGIEQQATVNKEDIFKVVKTLLKDPKIREQVRSIFREVREIEQENRD